MHIPAKKVELLLAELCVDLGCCVPPLEATRLAKDPPLDVESFTEAVLAAEGCDDLRARRDLRDRIAIHFRRWNDDAMQADLLDDLSRFAPKSPDA